MNEEKARKILGKCIQKDDELYISSGSIKPDVSWAPTMCGAVVLSGEFSIEQLEAIVWWMKNKGEEQ